MPTRHSPRPPGSSRLRARLRAALLACTLLVVPTVPASAATITAPATLTAPTTPAPILPADGLEGPGVVVDPTSSPPPAVTAQSWVVADLDSGDVLASSNAHVSLPPASTIKLLTLLALAPELPPDTLYTATQGDAAIDGSKVGMVPGSVYTVTDLLHGLMLASGNDAANALAALSGGMPAATTRMQDVADEIGATDTVVRNTSGLDEPGQGSTAYDLALVGRAVLERPELAELVTTTRYAFPGEGTSHGPERPRFEIANHNRLLTRYDGALGLKNGYTDAARGSFVAGVERDGRRYVVALMAAEGVTWQLSRDLLDWALAGGGDGEPVGSLDAVEPDPVLDASAQDGEQGSDGEATGSDGAGVPETALRTAGAGATPGLLTPTVVLLGLVSLVLGLRIRAVRRRRRRRAARRRARSLA